MHALNIRQTVNTLMHVCTQALLERLPETPCLKLAKICCAVLHHTRADSTEIFQKSFKQRLGTQIISSLLASLQIFLVMKRT